MSRFVLTIDLGNSEMSTYADIGQALEDVATTVRASGDSAPARIGGNIRDANGNTVGRWIIEEEEE